MIIKSIDKKAAAFGLRLPLLSFIMIKNAYDATASGAVLRSRVA